MRIIGKDQQGGRLRFRAVDRSKLVTLTPIHVYGIPWPASDVFRISVASYFVAVCRL